MLARALAVDPQLVICDGPADELDAAARAELLETLVRLQQSLGFALVVMAREFGDIASFARRVLVLSLGRTLEQGPVDTVVRMPAHPYSRRLLALASGNTVEERTEEGELLSDRETPSSANPPMGCVFHTRCSLVERSCVQSVPLLKRTTGVEHYAACHFAPVPS
jgi:oligopeptide/dipeptide ABC transporter ATP-binding protein